MSNNTTEEKGDLALINQCDTSVRHRRRIEIMIVRRAIRELKKAGYKVKAHDGESDPVVGTDRKMIDCLFGVDEAHIITRKGNDESFVFLVFGNDGYDVISDYGMSLEPVMAKVNGYANQLEEEGR